MEKAKDKGIAADTGVAEKAKTDAPVVETSKEKPKKAAKEVVKELDKEVAEFFEQYPNAAKVLKAGDCLYLPIHAGAAAEYARRMEVEVEEIVNPNLVG